jgi:hypothetical protein
MRFYTRPHHFYCGIDLHARTMYVCILNRDGEIVVHRNMKASPDALLKVIAPYRDDLVVAVECIFTWYWLADLCAQEEIPFVLGHALYMKAIHGVALHATVMKCTGNNNRGPEILLLGMLPGTAKSGASSWTLRRSAAPRRTVLPAAQLVRAILVSSRGRRRGASATCVTKRSAPPKVPSCLGGARRPRRWCSS